MASRQTVRAHGQDTEPAPVRVMLIDDHPLFRLGLKMALVRAGAHVVGEAASSDGALAGIRDLRPDVAVIDADLPGMDGLAVARELAPRYPGLRIIIISPVASDAELLLAIRYGATGYLLKDMDPDALARGILGSVDGDLAIPRRLAGRLVRRLAEISRMAHHPRRTSLGLTDREMDVLQRLPGGTTNRQIAADLALSPRTVARHVSSVLAKLGVVDRHAASAIYLREFGDGTDRLAGDVLAHRRGQDADAPGRPLPGPA